MHFGCLTALPLKQCRKCFFHLACLCPKLCTSSQAQQDSDAALQEARALQAQAEEQLADAARKQEEAEARLAAAVEREEAAAQRVAAAEERAAAAEEEAARWGRGLRLRAIMAGCEQSWP